MVTFNKPEMMPGDGKRAPMPVMHKHRLTCIKDAPNFPTGTTGDFYIAKYDNGRYCVFTASFIRIDNYHVFASEQELHDTFEEG